MRFRTALTALTFSLLASASAIPQILEDLASPTTSLNIYNAVYDAWFLPSGEPVPVTPAKFVPQVPRWFADKEASARRPDARAERRQTGPSAVAGGSGRLAVYVRGVFEGYLGLQGTAIAGAYPTISTSVNPADWAVVTVGPASATAQQITISGYNYPYLAVATGFLSSNGGIYANDDDYLLLTASSAVPAGPARSTSGQRGFGTYETVLWVVDANNNVTPQFVNPDGTTLAQQYLLMTPEKALLLTGNVAMTAATGNDDPTAVATLKFVVA